MNKRVRQTDQQCIVRISIIKIKFLFVKSVFIYFLKMNDSWFYMLIYNAKHICNGDLNG